MRACSSVGDTPRNRKQVANIRRKLTSPPPKDSLYEIMQKCLEDQSRSNPFIRCVNAAPEATCVLASDYQLNDLECFCTDEDEYAILGVDPTFNLGDFSLTVTTYRHLMLESRRTGKPPVLLGPMFAHQKKEMNSYHSFASALVGLKPSLSNLKCLGTDGELALSNGFSLSFPHCKHILCFLHVRKNISHKLSELGIHGINAKSIIHDIFGHQVGTHLVSGLVDSKSESEFDMKLELLKEKWDTQEKEDRQTDVAQFSNWFLRYHAHGIKTKMLLPLRESIGIGRGEYTTNDNEAMNAFIKQMVNYKASELSQFCEKMRKMVNEQIEDIERAFVMDTGPYRVSQRFKHLAKTPAQWVKLGKVAKDKQLKSIHYAPFKPKLHRSDNTDVHTCTTTRSGLNMENKEPVSSEDNLQLSVSLDDTGLRSSVFEGIWCKARELVSETEAIVKSPGADNVMICKSYTSIRPHIVTMFDSGKVVCDCKNNDNLCICAHSIAVAEKAGQLKKLIEWYKKSKQSANLWKLSRSSNVPKRPGAKPNQRQPRKTKNKVPVWWPGRSPTVIVQQCHTAQGHTAP